jgi:hypothetical protein
MEMSGQIHAPAALPQGKRLWYPFDRILRGPRSWSGRGGEEKNSQPLPGFEPQIIQPRAQRYATQLCKRYANLVLSNLGISEIVSKSLLKS